MKLCEFCNEYACGQSGTKAISEHCGDKDMKISCCVFSDSYEKAVDKIIELTSGKTRKVVMSGRYSRYYVEVDNEIWEYVRPTESKVRGLKPIKAYIDKDLSFKVIHERILPQCVFAVEIQYF